ncbi:MAG: hypothetical protein DRQ43_05900 [Gammaproteobacteria bacterium]|nr:MAG: hypothetical protein DRQ43_05900 [Gammaproteobacteria bacterium]
MHWNSQKKKSSQQDALHIAGWVSLFTLHTIWPFLWICSTLYREDRGWGLKKPEQLPQQASQTLFLVVSHHQAEKNNQLRLLLDISP